MAVGDRMVTEVPIDTEGQIARLGLYDVRHLNPR